MNQSELFEAIREGKSETVKRLLEEGCDPSSLEKGGHNNALSLAAYSKQPEMIESLLKKGARVNDRTKGGRVALHNAIWQYDKRSLELLLEAVRTFMLPTIRIGLLSGSLSNGSRLRFSSNEAQR
ncbi:ankyrin repeat protein [Leptospira santarosai str. CBC523]|nr:ankyrin repeat protein [Leptospira santarosai str. CBC523]